MPDPILLSMIRVNRHRLSGLRKVLQPHGYSGSMHLVLRHACRLPGESQEQVACYYGLDKTTVARDARRLEELGHITRSTVPEDRRRYALYPTEQGLAMYVLICRYYDELAKNMTAGLSEEERTQLERLLNRILQELEK